MASKARELANLGNAYSDGALSNRNLIINGAMQVAQRGTSVTGATATGYSTVDRWWHNASGGVMDMSQQSLAVGQTDLPSQFTKFFRFASTQGDNNQGFAQKIENVELLSGQTVTVSFYAKGTNPGAGYVALAYLQNFGSGGSANVEAEPYNITLTSSWQRFEATFTLPSVSGKTIGSGSSTWVYFRQASGNNTTTSWTMDITGVQLEVGDTATPFEHRSYGQELALCQRYYQRQFPARGVGVVNSSATQVGRIKSPLICTMRASPTATAVGSINFYDGSGVTGFSSFNQIWTTPDLFEFDVNLTGNLTADGRAAMPYNTATSGGGTLSPGGFVLDAEL